MTLTGLHNRHFLVLASNATTISIGFLVSFLLFHYLSMNDVGTWFFIMSLVAFLEAIRGGFLSTSVIAFYAGTTRERADTVLGSVWFLALVLCGVILSLNAGAALLVLPRTHNAELILCIKWVGITFFSSLPADIILWRLQADEQYGKMLMYKMLYSMSSVGAIIGLILARKMNLENALLFNFLTNSAVGILGVALNMSGFRCLVRRSKECIKELVHYGKYTLGTTSLSYLLANADTWFIQFTLGPATVAIYNLAKRFMAVVEMPLQTFLTTSMSQMSISYNKKNMEQVTYIFKKYSGMLTIAFIPLILMAVIVAEIPINFIGGARYHDSVATNVSRLLLLGALLYPLDRFNGLVLDIIRQNKSNFYKVIIMLGLKIVGNFAGLAILGNIYGIVFSNFLIITAAIIYGYYQLRKSIDYTIPEVLTLGYKECKNLIRKNLEVVPIRTQKIRIWTRNLMSRK
jgi:O-antigen/teichoic acid export membrane protein